MESPGCGWLDSCCSNCVFSVAAGNLLPGSPIPPLLTPCVVHLDQHTLLQREKGEGSKEKQRRGAAGERKTSMSSLKSFSRVWNSRAMSLWPAQGSAGIVHRDCHMGKLQTGPGQDSSRAKPGWWASSLGRSQESPTALQGMKYWQRGFNLELNLTRKRDGGSLLLASGKCWEERRITGGLNQSCSPGPLEHCTALLWHLGFGFLQNNALQVSDETAIPEFPVQKWKEPYS